METLKNLGRSLYSSFLRLTRGLFFEHTPTGWEISKGRVMSWALFLQMIRMADRGDLPPETILYGWALAMGYTTVTKLAPMVAKRPGETTMPFKITTS